MIGVFVAHFYFKMALSMLGACRLTFLKYDLAQSWFKKLFSKANINVRKMKIKSEFAEPLILNNVTLGKLMLLTKFRIQSIDFLCVSQSF